MPLAVRNKFNLTNRGFSVIEILIALSIFAISAFALTELISLFNRDLRQQEQKVEISELEMKAKEVFSTAGQCKELFRGFSGYATGNTVLVNSFVAIGMQESINEFYGNSSRTELVAKKGQKIQGSTTGLLVKDIRFENFILINTEAQNNVNYDNYMADFVIEFELGNEGRHIPPAVVPVILNTYNGFIQSCFDRAARPVEVFTGYGARDSEVPHVLHCPPDMQLMSYNGFCSEPAAGSGNQFCNVNNGFEDYLYSPKIMQIDANTVEFSCPGASMSNQVNTCFQIVCKYN